jgi:serine O-acetyltransferase
MILRFRYEHLSMKLGFTIPLNVFGPGLSIAHRGTIVVNSGTKVGANCRLHVCVNIGTAANDSNAAPAIGNNVYIGPGVKIFGKITIADDIAIGANAVVNKSFVEPSITIAGIPARKISGAGSKGLLKKGATVSI